MTDRRSLSPMKRLAVFESCEGICHICGFRIQAGQKWDIEHIVPLALGGRDETGNMRSAHKACHATKTATDVADIARAKRRKAKHLGIKQRSSFPKPPPGYRYDWKRRTHVKETA